MLCQFIDLMQIAAHYQYSRRNSVWLNFFYQSRFMNFESIFQRKHELGFFEKNKIQKDIIRSVYEYGKFILLCNQKRQMAWYSYYTHFKCWWVRNIWITRYKKHLNAHRFVYFTLSFTHFHHLKSILLIAWDFIHS